MKARHKRIAKAVVVYVITRGGVSIGAPAPTKTTLFPPPPSRGMKGAGFNGEWFPNDAQDPDGTGYYRDTNKQWWLIRRSGSLADPSNDWTVAIVEPNNRYGRSPGWVTGTFSSAADAKDGADRFAIQARLIPSAFPWWLVAVAALAYKRRRR